MTINSNYKQIKQQEDEIKYNIGLDIDNVLTCSRSIPIERTYFFHKYGAITKILSDDYHIFPWVKEFIKRLHLEKTIRTSFYSAGGDIRNALFVEKLQTLSLDKQEYNKIKNDICILSRDDRGFSTKAQRKQRTIEFNLTLSPRPKDISKIVKEGEDLKNAILIDDSITNAAHDQMQNFLLSPELNTEIFHSLYFQKDQYSPEGYKPLACEFFTEYTPEIKAFSKKHNKISVVRIKNTLAIHFPLKKNDKYKKETIQIEGNEDLFAKLEMIKPLSDEFINCQIADEDIIEHLHAFVESYSGKTRHLCYEANRIVYITGCIFKAIEKSQKKGLPLSDIIFKWHFKKMDDGTFRNKCARMQKKDSLYFRGLEELRKVNPDANFITPHDYTNCIKTQLTDWEKLQLKLGLNPGR